MTIATQKRMDSGLRDAIDAYRKACQKALDSKGSTREEGPFFVAGDVALLAYETWSILQESQWKLLYDKKTREIWLYGDPSEPHETTIYWFTKEIPVVLTEIGGRGAERAIRGTGSTTRDLPEKKKNPISVSNQKIAQKIRLLSVKLLITMKVLPD